MCLRFCLNIRRKQSDRIYNSTLTPTEIQQATTVLLKQSQDESFAGICRIIRSGKGLQKTNILFCLQPFLVKHSLIRVGGRLQKTDLPQQSIHPIILHCSHHLAKLIVQNLRITSSHAGPSMMLATVSESYYIIGVKRLIHSISKNCVACQRTYLHTASQQMGQLPETCTTPAPPFHSTGVDFAGPRGVTLGNL